MRKPAIVITCVLLVAAFAFPNTALAKGGNGNHPVAGPKAPGSQKPTAPKATAKKSKAKTSAVKKNAAAPRPKQSTGASESEGCRATSEDRCEHTQEDCEAGADGRERTQEDREAVAGRRGSASQHLRLGEGRPRRSGGRHAQQRCELCGSVLSRDRRARGHRDAGCARHDPGTRARVAGVDARRGGSSVIGLRLLVRCLRPPRTESPEVKPPTASADTSPVPCARLGE